MPFALVVCALAGCEATKTGNGLDAGAFMTVESMDRLKHDLKEFGDFYDSTVDQFLESHSAPTAEDF